MATNLSAVREHEGHQDVATLWFFYKISMMKNDNITQMSSVGSMAYANGSLKQELSYDAWGRLRNPATQVVYPPARSLHYFWGVVTPIRLRDFQRIACISQVF